jgi:hypothetical protein
MIADGYRVKRQMSSLADPFARAPARIQLHAGLALFSNRRLKQRLSLLCSLGE